MQRSIELWVSKVVVGTDPTTRLWASSYPLPIGREAVGRLYASHGKSGGGELMSLLPFEGAQEALWALRIEARRSVLHMFGLKGRALELDDAAHDYLWLGGFAYSLRGRDDTSLLPLVSAGYTWWRDFSLRKIRGRPPGSGAFESRAFFLRAVSDARRELEAQGRKVTQEAVAGMLHTSDRQLRQWIKDHGTTWHEVKKL